MTTNLLQPRVFCIGAVLLLASIAAAPASALASPLDQYQIFPSESFHLPVVGTGQQPPAVFDALGDGRLIVVTTTDGDAAPQNGSAAVPRLFVESAVGSRSFDLVGELPLDVNSWTDFGASFLRVSPGGHHVAVGNNGGRIGVFDGTGLSGGGSAPVVTWFETDEFVGAWFDDTQLAVGNTSGVVIFDATPSIATTLAPTTDLVITGMAASGDVAFDAAGNLYTADGFGPAAGLVKRFDLVDWQTARTDGTPLSFSTDGDELLTFSSGASLRIDVDGNIIVGGGRFDLPFSESNGIGLFSPDGSEMRILDPNMANNDQGNFYTLGYNPATGEIFVQEPFALNFGQPVDHTLIHVIRPVPEPSTLLLAGLGAGLCCVGYLRRRNCS
ncbi:MAG: PEP-CTERM sorting domain-containing protein [Pirellulales bacterium]